MIIRDTGLYNALAAFKWAELDEGDEVARYESDLSGTEDGLGWGEVSDGVAYVMEADGGILDSRSSSDEADLRAWVEAQFA